MNKLNRLLPASSLFATGSLIVSLIVSSLVAEPIQRPNLVIIMPDDLGWADVGFNQVESLRAERDDLAITLEIDRLCAGGMRLNRFYVQPICTPTRAALMTGRYPWRSGMASGVILNHLEYGLPLDETTLAEVLRDAGYGTYIIGKWHLGHHAAEYLPTERGFDYHYGLYMAIDHFTRYWQGGLDWHRNREPVREEGYATDLLADDIERIVAEHDFSERPMFLYHAMFAPHAWNQATEEYMAPFQHVEDEGRRGLLGLLAAMDNAVMRTVRAFEKAGQLENTLFLFFSDNGGNIRQDAINYPLRASKGSYYEGGVRVPAFAYWPGRIEAGTSTDGLMYVADVFPTFAALAGARLPEKTLDGFDLTPVLIGDEASTGRSEIVFILEDSERERRGAMIDWPWKLRRTATPDGPWHMELYNLEDDPFESADGIQQARSMPQLSQRLSNRLSRLKEDAPRAFWQQGDSRVPPDWRAPAVIGPDHLADGCKEIAESCIVAGPNQIPSSKPKRKLPNIVILMTDDMGQEMGAYGDPMNVTPHLDQLAAEGIRFNNAHVTAASSSPSRGSVFTGLFPHQHGMYSLSQLNWARMHDDVPKLSVELNKLGYHTSILGKTHFEPFDHFEWDVFIHDGRKVNLERDVRWMNQQAMGILDSLPVDKPYFMVVSYIDPHRGGGAGREDPDVGIGRYAPGKNLIFPRIRSGLPENPPAPEDTIPLPYLGVDSPEVRMEISDYYSAIMRLDTGIGEFLQALEERGDAEDTLVIFFGDHGADVTRGKMAVYASATRIPLVIRWPGQIAPGSVRDELVSTIDLFPTIMTAVGSDFSDPRQTGLPLQRLWQASEAEWRTGLATQLITHVPWHYYPRYSWFEGDYHLIHNLHHERPGPLEGRNFCFAWWEVQKPEFDGTPIREVYDRVTHPPEFELYNLKEDSYEFVNLADRPGYQPLVNKLHGRIQSWRESTADPFLDPAYGEAYHEKVLEMQANRGR